MAQRRVLTYDLNKWWSRDDINWTQINILLRIHLTWCRHQRGLFVIKTTEVLWFLALARISCTLERWVVVEFGKAHCMLFYHFIIVCVAVVRVSINYGAVPVVINVLLGAIKCIRFCLELLKLLLIGVFLADSVLTIWIFKYWFCVYDSLPHLNDLILKLPYMFLPPLLLVFHVYFFVFICLFENFNSHLLVASLICNIHMSSSHRQAQRSFLFLCFLMCRLDRLILQLFEFLLIFFIFFLDLVADKSHILTCPNNWHLIRCRCSTCKNVSLLNGLRHIIHSCFQTIFHRIRVEIALFCAYWMVFVKTYLACLVHALNSLWSKPRFGSTLSTCWSCCRRCLNALSLTPSWVGSYIVNSVDRCGKSVVNLTSPLDQTALLAFSTCSSYRLLTFNITSSKQGVGDGSASVAMAAVFLVQSSVLGLVGIHFSRYMSRIR